MLKNVPVSINFKYEVLCMYGFVQSIPAFAPRSKGLKLCISSWSSMLATLHRNSFVTM